jgi:hypothetical protein
LCSHWLNNDGFEKTAGGNSFLPVWADIIFAYVNLLALAAGMFQLQVGHASAGLWHFGWWTGCIHFPHHKLLALHATSELVYYQFWGTCYTLTTINYCILNAIGPCLSLNTQFLKEILVPKNDPFSGTTMNMQKVTFWMTSDDKSMAQDPFQSYSNTTTHQ